MTELNLHKNKLEALTKQYIDLDATKNNSNKCSGPSTIIGLYIYGTPNQNIAEAFCDAKKQLNEAYVTKEAREAKRVLYNAAFYPSMNSMN